MKAIVVYYSWGGNTKSIAEKIARDLNCGTARIDTVVPYEGDYNSIVDQELLCRGWFLPPNTYDCGSFVVNGTAVVGKETKNL